MNVALQPEVIDALVTSPKSRSNMDAKFLGVFLQAVVDVLSAEIGGTVERGVVALERSAYATGDVNVIMTIVGGLQGVVIYGMPQATALGIVSQMIGQPVSELDELAQSGIAELGNVITGRAGTLLGQMGFATNLSVPTLVIGHAMLSVLDFHRVVVPLMCQCGPLEVHLALREVPSNQG